MEASTKKIVGTLAVVAAIGGGFYLIKKGKKLFAGSKMNFALLGFRIQKLTTQEFEFVVKLRCYNPTKAPITLAINQIVANYKGSSIAYSTPDIKGMTIEAGKMLEPEITFQVPYLNLLGKGLTLSALQNTTQLKADLTFTLTITINGETITTTQNLTEDNMSGLPIGQVGIVSGPRNVKDGRKYNNLIRKADGKDLFLKNGNVLETVESCIDLVADHFREVEDLANALKADTLKNTCHNIFNLAYNYLQYYKDEDGTEQLRTPARSWLDGQIKYRQRGDADSGIDCDDYAIFCGSLLKCLGIPFKFRITKYDGRINYQHIYVFVPAASDSENEIIIDPVLSRFDYQKPYSAEKSDFDMSPIEMVAGIHGINGLTGVTGLGLPIYALSGIDTTGGRMADNNHTELMAIVSGIDFENTMNGLGNPQDATLKYLMRTRDFLLKNKENKNRMAHIQNPDQFISMLDQAIKYWNTPERDKVLDKLIAIEDKLAENGFIRYDADAIEGFDEFDDLMDELDDMEDEGAYDDIEGLEGRRARRARRATRKAKRKQRRARFFRAVKRVGKKVGKAAKKVVKTIVRFNPLTIAIRGGLLTALRLNLFGISKKLQYAYLPDSLAGKYHIDLAKLRDLKRRHAKVKRLFHGLQGKDANLRKAILKGAKQKSRDFSLRGTDGIIAGLSAIGESADFGDLGVVATAASVSAASGVLATIKKWLAPVKNIFSKVRGKVAAKKVARREKKGKEVSPEIRQRATQYLQQQATQTQEQIAPKSTSYSIPQTSTFLPITSDTTQMAPGSMALRPKPVNMPKTTKKGISKGAKVGIGLGVAALIGTGAYLLFRKKDEGSKSKSKTQKTPEKKSLGSITLS